MVKRLVNGGPCYWIEEPLTEMEERRYAASRARHARRMIKRDPAWKADEEFQQDLANDPKLSRAEVAQIRAEYPPDYAMTEAEAKRRMNPNGEVEFYRELYGPDGTNHTTVIYGRHR